MAVTTTIALVGDYNPTVTAHKAIPKALELAGQAVGINFAWEWVETDAIASKFDAIREFDAYWVVPASPYANMVGVLSVIRFARENQRPFLGTCGGYQHAVLEYARSVLGHSAAGNAEVDADCTMPVIAPLVCAMVETEDQIDIQRGSKLAALLGVDHLVEGFRCSYGVNPEYLPLFAGSKLRFTGTDNEGAPCAFELADHPFFFGTAFQPERQALSGVSHNLIETFVAAAVQKKLVVV